MKMTGENIETCKARHHFRFTNDWNNFRFTNNCNHFRFIAAATCIKELFDSKASAESTKEGNEMSTRVDQMERAEKALHSPKALYKLRRLFERLVWEKCYCGAATNHAFCDVLVYAVLDNRTGGIVPVIAMEIESKGVDSPDSEFKDSLGRKCCKHTKLFHTFRVISTDKFS